MQVIQLNDTPKDAVIKMSEGNPGALTVLMQLLRVPDAVLMLLNLDAMECRGAKIWMAFNDYCKRDIEKFKQAIMKRDQDMIDFIEG